MNSTTTVFYSWLTFVLWLGNVYIIYCKFVNKLFSSSCKTFLALLSFQDPFQSLADLLFWFCFQFVLRIAAGPRSALIQKEDVLVLATDILETAECQTAFLDFFRGIDLCTKVGRKCLLLLMGKSLIICHSPVLASVLWWGHLASKSQLYIWYLAYWMLLALSLPPRRYWGRWLRFHKEKWSWDLYCLNLVPTPDKCMCLCRE